MFSRLFNIRCHIRELWVGLSMVLVPPIFNIGWRVQVSHLKVSLCYLPALPSARAGLGVAPLYNSVCSSVRPSQFDMGTLASSFLFRPLWNLYRSFITIIPWISSKTDFCLNYWEKLRFFKITITNLSVSEQRRSWPVIGLKKVQVTILLFLY